MSERERSDDGVADRARAHEALEALPDLDHAFDEGRADLVCGSLVRGHAKTERAWLEASKGRTVREIERLVAATQAPAGEAVVDWLRPAYRR